MRRFSPLAVLAALLACHDLPVDQSNPPWAPESIVAIPGVWGNLVPLAGSPTTLLGNGDSGLVALDVEGGALTAYPTSMHSSNCNWGPGVTPNASQLILATLDSLSSCHLKIWNTAPSFAPETDAMQYSLDRRVVANIAPHLWLFNQHNFAYVFADNAAIDTSFGTNVARVDLSPRGDRAAVEGQGLPGGAGSPVLDATKPSVAYWSSLAWIGGAAFSPAGDTLLLAGGYAVSGSPPATLHVLNATDGRVLDSLKLGMAVPGAVSFDPGGKWIYVSGVYDTYHVTSHKIGVYLEVIDRTTLKPVTLLQSDSVTFGSGGAFASQQVIVASPATHQVYVVSSDVQTELPGTTTGLLSYIITFKTP